MVQNQENSYICRVEESTIQSLFQRDDSKVSLFFYVLYTVWIYIYQVVHSPGKLGTPLMVVVCARVHHPSLSLSLSISTVVVVAAIRADWKPSEA